MLKKCILISIHMELKGARHVWHAYLLLLCRIYAHTIYGLDLLLLILLSLYAISHFISVENSTGDATR